VTLTELRYIVAVAREKHFGRAAEACFVSQPTLSVAIKKLEEELDVKLFERGANEVSVTPLGEEIVRQAQSVIEQAAGIKEIAKRGKDPVSGPLRLGVIYTIGPYLLPDLVRQAIARVPQMPLMLQENFTIKLLDMLRTRHGALLGYHYMSQAKDVATIHFPIQAWYSTATEDFKGFISADLPSGDLGYGVMSTLGEPAGYNTSGSRLGDGLKSEVPTAVIIVDTGKIAGQEIGPLADYIAMLALSQGQYYDTCQEIPTITNLMAPGCGADMKPVALTDIDVTYLRGLYKMDAGTSFMGERGSIAYEMKKDLGGY